jgi:hypothetical protein
MVPIDMNWPHNPSPVSKVQALTGQIKGHPKPFDRNFPANFGRKPDKFLEVLQDHLESSQNFFIPKPLLFENHAFQVKEGHGMSGPRNAKNLIATVGTMLREIGKVFLQKSYVGFIRLAARGKVRRPRLDSLKGKRLILRLLMKDSETFFGALLVL